MSNKDVEIKILSCGFKKWEIAMEIGIADTTFSKWLRTQLSQERRVKVIAAIEKLVTERGA